MAQLHQTVSLSNSTVPTKFWHPEDELSDSRYCSFVVGVAQETAQRPLAVVLAIFDGLRVFFLPPSSLKDFLQTHPDKRLICHSAADVLEIIRDVFGDAVSVADMVDNHLFHSVDILYRLHRLAKEDDAGRTRISLDDIYAFYFGDENPFGKITGIMSGYDLWSKNPKEIPSSALKSIVDCSILLFQIHREQKGWSSDLFKELNEIRSFGYVDRGWLRRQWKTYGVLTNNIQIKADIVHREISRNGLAIDMERVQLIWSKYSEEKTILLDRLRENGYRSTKQKSDDNEVCRILAGYERTAGVYFERSGDGKISLSKDSLGDYCKEFPFIEHLLRLKEIERYQSYLAKMDKPVLHPQYDILLRSGRVSSSGDIASQTLPKRGGIRECIVPRPGSVFVVADFTMAELVVFANILQRQFKYDSELYKAIVTGKDLHRSVAAMIFVKDEKSLTGEERNQAKILNFGIPGGLGITGLRKSAKNNFLIDWSEADAYRMKERWLDLFPEVRSFLQPDRSDSFGVVTLTGRYRNSQQLTENRNTVFQGIAADGMKLALWRLWKAGFKIVNVIHDEVMLEVPIHSAYESIVADIEHHMRNGIEEIVSGMKIRVESVVTTRWSKSAEKIHDEQGRLAAWSPSEM